MKRTNSIMKQYEAVLHAIKTITKADDCSIFLFDSELGMDEEEKKEVFKERIEDIRNANKDNTDAAYYKFMMDLTEKETEKYCILTFFVGTTGDHWRMQSYKIRPHKYIVFNWPSTDADHGEPIVKEGITAFSARTGKSLALDVRSNVEKHTAFTAMNEGPNLVHDNCCQVAIIPLKDEKEKIIGVIRCDIYDLNRLPIFTKEQTLPQLEAINDILCKIIHLGKESETEFSYDKLFYGIKLLESLKEIEDKIEDGTDKNIYKYSKKIFYVLKRRRYFGEDAIIRRVTGYIEDVCDALELDKTPMINLLDSFKKHEDLMLYSNTNYRDHFMHQFHVFVVGYIILHYIGIGKVATILNDNVEKLHGVKLTIKNILRIWFLTSMFHDCSYLIPKFDKNIGAFLAEILEDPNNESDKYEFSVDLKWDQLEKEEAGFLKKLSIIAEYLQIKHRPLNLAKIAIELNRLMLEKNHGVIGALIMLQKMSRADRWKQNIAFDIEKNIASLAIALHSPEAYQKARELFGVGEFIVFENYPIVFLLAYCDFIQEWGRKTTSKAKKLGSPIFYSLSHNQADNGIICKLLYTPSSFLSGQAAPNQEQLEEWSRNLRYAFSSLNISFIVEYHHFELENLRPAKKLERGDIGLICPPVNLRCVSQRKGARYQCEQIYSMLDGNIDAYFTDFSFDSYSGKCGIGFGSNANFDNIKQLYIPFKYGGTDLSGDYLVKRVSKAASGLPYDKFVGLEKLRPTLQI